MFRVNPILRPRLAIILVCWACVLVNHVCGQQARTIPSPQPAGWVVDQTNTLSEYQKDLIDKLCKNVQQNSRHELAVAIVETTGGRFARQFATDLFNHWGIGRRTNDRGILVFLAVKDRRAEIILGEGIDDDRSRRLAIQIMDRVMIPNLKKGDAGSAVYEGVRACARQILNVGPLQVDDRLPEINAEAGPAAPTETSDANEREMLKGIAGGSTNGNGTRESRPDRLPADESNDANSISSASRSAAATGDFPQRTESEDDDVSADSSGRDSASSANRYRPPIHRRPWFPWAVGFGALGTVGAFLGARYWWRYRTRLCEACQIERVLLNEIQDDELLEAPQVLEEKIGSVDYDVWACLECEDVIRIRHARWFTRYSRCPQCNFVTRFKIKKTILPATTISGGLVRVNENCKNCLYHHTYTYATPRIQTRSRSSGGGFRSSGGFRGGFGGGRSAGGGASGRW